MHSCSKASPNPTSDSSLCVPGFGLPYDHELPHDQFFRHGINDSSWPRMTVKEIAMLGLMESITDKVEWRRKVMDDSIVEKWRKEALAIDFMSDQAFDWCISELREKAKNASKLVVALDTASRVIKADDLIPCDLRDRIRDQIQPLLDGSKDWHPHSDEKVLDLVHPSMYPAVYGRTRVQGDSTLSLDDALTPCDSTTTLPSISADAQASRPDLHSDQNNYSRRFQWLPCDVKFVGDKGTKVTISSYINNLHPIHEELYKSVEEVIGYAIPAWNEILLRDHHARTLLRINTNGPIFDPDHEPEWIRNLSQPGSASYEEDLQKVRDYLKSPDRPLPSYVGADNYDLEEYLDDARFSLWGTASRKFKRLRTTIHPEPDMQDFRRWNSNRTDESSGPPRGDSKPYPVNIENEFRKQGLQIIVKLASIELTPEKPEYDGGNWHLEGAMNEHIVATAIYYFDTENLTESRIRMRHQAFLDEDELQYEQSEHTPLCEIFGTATMYEEPAIQEIGSVATPQNRLLCFPNTLQHKVEPFKLSDASRPGHRRILVLWLVDPHYRILSTSNVPPQQHEWWVREATLKARLGERVPKEIEGMITEFMKDGLMTLDEAKQHRIELMEERVVIKESMDAGVDTYFLCEH